MEWRGVGGGGVPALNSNHSSIGIFKIMHRESKWSRLDRKRDRGSKMRNNRRRREAACCDKLNRAKLHRATLLCGLLH